MATPLFSNPPDWLVGPHRQHVVPTLSELPPSLVTHAPMIFRHQHSALQYTDTQHSVENWLELHFRLNLRHPIKPLPPLPLLPISLASPDFTHSHGRHFKYLTPQLLDDDDNIDKARTAEFSYSQTCFESIVGQFCHLSDNSSVLQRVPFNCFRPLLIIYPDVYDLLITISRHIFFTFLSPFCGWLSLF